MTIAVFGSLNLDLVVRSPRLPLAGETVLGTDFTQVPGGKGANQAVAAARLGTPTRLVGRVGQDDFGSRLVAAVQAAGVETEGIERDSTTTTGVAAIAVAANGENHILVVPGANGNVEGGDVSRLHLALTPPRYLLMQLEIPLAAVMAAAQAAQAAGVTVILDPAPAPLEFPAPLYGWVDVLTPNQGEAAQLVGHGVDTVEAAIAAARTLQQRGTGTVIITLGALGCVAVQGETVWQVPSFAVEVVDTVAAGDAFNGALAVALGEGKSLESSLTWASAAAALTVTQPGAQPALPTRSALDSFLAGHLAGH